MFNSKKKFLYLKALKIAFPAVLLSLVIYYPLGFLLPFLGIDNNNSFYIKHYYDTINKSLSQAEGQDYITIINTQHFDESTARKKITELIEGVCELNPLAVGVDIRFSSKKDSLVDAKLEGVINQNSDKIILAQAYQGNTLLSNIFDGDSLHYGITNLPDFYSYSPTKLVNGKQYPLFSYQVFRIAKPDKVIYFNRFLVNYSSVSFNPINAEDFLEESKDVQRSFIDGKVILLGDIENSKDYHYSPFLIQGQEWTQGVFLHAYAIYSLLEQSRAITTLPWWLNLIICLILCYLFSLVFVLLFDKNRIRESSFVKRNQPLYILLRPLFLIIVDGLIYVLFFFLVTLPFGIIPDIVLYMISVLLINTFNDFVSNRINVPNNEEI